MSIKNIDLALKVRRKPKSEKVRQSKRMLGTGIDGRPEAADAREESGHWEIDLAVGKKLDKAAVPATVERTARSQITAEFGGFGSAVEAAAGEIIGGFVEAIEGRCGLRRLFLPSPLKLQEGGRRAPQRTSAPPREKREKRGRHVRAALRQGGGLEQQPSQKNIGLQDSGGNVWARDPQNSTEGGTATSPPPRHSLFRKFGEKNIPMASVAVDIAV
ncbi:MAG: hypothetical protein LBU32_27620 [Clostridiales bacterium]|jgi:hypothetical protein|nr:hypothetical protein [Clostridiales bacterium]